MAKVSVIERSDLEKKSRTLLRASLEIACIESDPETIRETREAVSRELKKITDADEEIPWVHIGSAYIEGQQRKVSMASFFADRNNFPEARRILSQLGVPREKIYNLLMLLSGEGLFESPVAFSGPDMPLDEQYELCFSYVKKMLENTVPAGFRQEIAAQYGEGIVRFRTEGRVDHEIFTAMLNAVHLSANIGIIFSNSPKLVALFTHIGVEERDAMAELYLNLLTHTLFDLSAKP